MKLNYYVWWEKNIDSMVSLKDSDIKSLRNL